MCADFQFHVKTIETHSRAFLTLNISAIDRVTTYSAKLTQPSVMESHGQSLFAINLIKLCTKIPVIMLLAKV